MKTIYFIGGTMGVGKTTVGKELSKRINNSIYIEGDDGWIGIPFVVNEENKRIVLNNIIRMINDSMEKFDYIILGWVMDYQYILDSIINGIKNKTCLIYSFSLIATEETIRNRLLKDVQNGIRKEAVIERSIARLPLFNSVDSIKIDTTDKSVDEIVNIIQSYL